MQDLKKLAYFNGVYYDNFSMFLNVAVYFVPSSILINYCQLIRKRCAEVNIVRFRRKGL